MLGVIIRTCNAGPIATNASIGNGFVSFLRNTFLLSPHAYLSHEMFLKNI